MRLLRRFSFKMSLKVKLIALFLLVGLVPVAVVSVLSYNSAASEVEYLVYQELVLFADLKVYELVGFFDERRADATVLAATWSLRNSMDTLLAVEGDLSDPAWLARADMELQYWHTMAEAYGLEAVFLTDAHGLGILATNPDLEEFDYTGRDYVRGSLSGNVTTSELFYSDVINANAMVVSAPIYSWAEPERLVGTVNLLFDDTIIGHMVHHGLYIISDYADAYLIDADGLLLTNTMLGDLSTGAALYERIRSRAVELLGPAIRAGDDGFAAQEIYPDYDGTPVLGTMEVVPFGDGWAGLVVEEYEAEAMAAVNALLTQTLIIAGVTIAAVALFGFFIAMSIARPIGQVTELAKIVAGGDFTGDIAMKRSDEIGQLATAFSTMNGNLRDLIRQAIEMAGAVNQSSEGLSSSAESTASSLQQVAATTNQFASGTQQLNAAAVEMDGISKQVAGNAAEGSQAVEDAVRQMQEINTMVGDLRGVIDNLDKRSQEIGDIVGLITAVADQTNLLALNAAIEAARAGEHGAGFAVVAEEVRKLAEQAGKAAGEISVLVKATQDETGQAVESMDRGVAQVKEGTEVVLASGATFKSIVDNVETLVARIGQVSEGAQEISSGAEEISASTEEQSSAMEEITATSEELRASAEELASALGRFKYQ